MTSSLVGSEMCIRDSKCSPQSATLSLFAPCGSMQSTLGWLHRRSPQLWAVSYTHLTLPTICSV
eukprot:7558836-Prorocentrum_lima.AAC.1